MFHLKFPWFAGCLKIWLSLSHVTTSLQRAGCQSHLWSCGDLRSPSKQCRDPAFQASGGSALHSLQWGACSMTAAHLHGDRHCFPCLRVCSQKYSIFCLKSSGSTLLHEDRTQNSVTLCQSICSPSTRKWNQSCGVGAVTVLDFCLAGEYLL